MERQSRLLQPLAQLGNRRRVVVVEVAARGEHLDRLEPVRRNLRQVIAAQALGVKEVRRNTKTHDGELLIVPPRPTEDSAYCLRI